MLQDIYRICSEPLLRAAAFPSGIPASDPREVREWFQARLERMLAEGRALGLREADLAEARYALVAFIDEQVLRSSWQGREEWMKQPLQLVLYRENLAGETFFRRLRGLLSAPNRLPAVQVYALCLALGFRGVYQQASDGEALTRFRRAAFRRLSAALPSRLVSSPHLERPAQTAPPPDPKPIRLALWVCCLSVGVVLTACSWRVWRAQSELIPAPGAGLTPASGP